MNIDWFWPTLSASKGEADELRKQDLEFIKEFSETQSSDIILDEARRLYDQEQARRAVIDSKAGIYIAIATALIAILLSLAPLLIDVRVPIDYQLTSFLDVLTVLTLILSWIALIRCTLWSHQALKVSAFHQLNWKILITSDANIALDLQLIKKLLTCLRCNYDLTNDAATSVKMAHALVTSAWLWLIISMLSRLLSYVIGGFEENPAEVDVVSPIINVFTMCSGIV